MNTSKRTIKNTRTMATYTKEQIAQWKSQWGDVYEIKVEDKSCVLHKPSRKDLSYVGVVKDPVKASEVLLKQLWIAGDEEIQTRDDLFMAAVSVMDEVIKVKAAEIKKL